jgi:MSHA biogenesis protein MshJ
MKMPPAVQNGIERFDRLSLRERALVSIGFVAVVILAWDSMLMKPLDAKRLALNAEMESINQSSAATGELAAASANGGPIGQALAHEKELNAQLDSVNAALNASSTGLIDPRRMGEVLRDLLAKQHDLHLVSLRNLPVHSLVVKKPVDLTTSSPAEVAASNAVASDASTATATSEAAAPEATAVNEPVSVEPQESGPYVHPAEIIIEGSYMDVLAYLKTIEALPWHFYWQRLELQSGSYPKTRVRIELATLSLDKEWLGV